MNIHLFCETLGFDESTEKQLSPLWDNLYSHSSDELPFFMKKDFYSAYLPLCGMREEEDILKRMDQVSAVTAASPVCARYAAMLHYALYLSPRPVSLNFLPLPVRAFQENAGIFQLMVALSALPLIRETHRKMGLPEQMLADTATWLAGTMQIFRAGHNGLPGFNLRQGYWLRYHIKGHLFRIGRLEYLTGIWKDSQPAVYRNRRTGRIAVLCGDFWKFDKDGCFDPELGTPPAFVSRLRILDGSVIGTPITPDGAIHPEITCTLPQEEWEPLITPWEQIPSIHIPGGSGMTIQAIRESMQQARIFFRKYLHTEVRAFICNSWILDPAWQKELPHSNMGAFQRNGFLLPAGHILTGGLFFVYGISDGDPRKLPRTTALHEAFCRIWDRGEHLKYGGLFILAEDVDKIGQEFYLSHLEEYLHPDR